ncbi:type II secretion system F family protein [Escherichia coli]|uniref:type II secretion system F family protein n=1 Tax=Escherichia coli TaxID=562 RepID=UPI003D818A14
MRQRLANAAENVRQGNSIHLSLEQTAIFPPMMLYMVASGERFLPHLPGAGEFRGC